MYIEQALKGKFHIAKYLPIPFLFLGLLVLNFLVIKFMNLDVNRIISDEISKKGENRFLVESLIPFVIGLFALFFWVKYIHQQSITSLTTSRKKIDWNRVLFSFLIWGMFSIISTLLLFYLNPNDFEINFELIPFLTLLVIAVLLIPIQTSFEEYLFRGYLMQGIGMASKNRWLPLIITSVIFGSMHLSNPEVTKMGNIIMVYYIGTGFFLGIITLMDEGMELALGFHAANNLIGALLITSDWTAFQTHSVLKDISEPTAGFDVIIPVVVIFPILLFIFSKKYHWTNWKEKLTGTIIIENQLNKIGKPND